ncbi:hypothetical protein GGR57DRAFT_36458 [Xylariaceae sp. FL1272]|nr:hypothetical protein GGR57DRAFT_36458 [Xylariaceae sp. FL1272]
MTWTGWAMLWFALVLCLVALAVDSSPSPSEPDAGTRALKLRSRPPCLPRSWLSMADVQGKSAQCSRLRLAPMAEL